MAKVKRLAPMSRSGRAYNSRFLTDQSHRQIALSIVTLELGGTYVPADIRQRLTDTITEFLDAAVERERVRVSSTVVKVLNLNSPYKGRKK